MHPWQGKKIYTIGYGNRKPEAFAQLLHQNGRPLVVDVRLRPDQASLYFWRKTKSSLKGIEENLRQMGLQYVSLIELGNVFMDCDVWRISYMQMLNGAGEVITHRLSQVQAPFCLMCAELDFERCHRQILADYLHRAWGVEVHHII